VYEQVSPPPPKKKMSLEHNFCLMQQNVFICILCCNSLVFCKLCLAKGYIEDCQKPKKIHEGCSAGVAWVWGGR
jgi:hypothetical protein